MANQPAASAAGASGVVALLDLPSGTSVTIDGSTHAMRREDFVGVSRVPPSGFHLIVVSSAGDTSATSTSRDTGSAGREQQQEKIIPKPSALHTTGFVLLGNKICDDDKPNIADNGWIVARRYDPQTEELSSNPVDDVTTTNLLKAVQDGTIGAQRVVPYDRFLTQPVEKWNDLAAFITPSLLTMRGIVSGGKLIPGSYNDEDFNERQATEEENTGAGSLATTNDGLSISYPPMPCIEGSSLSKSPAHISRIGHAGTKRYLSQLSPPDRTALFLDTEPGSKVLEILLRQYYDGRWEQLVGDVQLSFLLFLHLGCLSSFEHWRDTISMLSFASAEAVASHIDLYTNIIRITSRHLSWIERDFFDEVEYSGGNFYVPALNRFALLSCECGDAALLNASRELGELAQSRFGIKLASAPQKLNHKRSLPGQSSTSFNGSESSDDENVMEVDMRDGSVIDVSAAPSSVDDGKAGIELPDYENDENDYEDGPVIVSEEDVEASLARSAASTHAPPSNDIRDGDKANREKYPLIFAAMAPQEDIVMTCARVLDEAIDVSLVREAAAYLEEVEAKR